MTEKKKTGETAINNQEYASRNYDTKKGSEL